MCRWDAVVPQDIDGAIARWRQASGLARRNSLIMRPANAAKRRLVTLLPSRGATAQDSAPDDDVFQVRKPAAFACGLWSGGESRPMLHASSRQSEATLEGAVGEIMTLIIQICTALFGIAQGRPQSCDPPSRNGFEGRSVHLFSPFDRCSPAVQRASDSMSGYTPTAAGIFPPLVIDRVVTVDLNSGSRSKVPWRRAQTARLLSSSLGARAPCITMSFLSRASSLGRYAWRRR